MEQGQSGTFDMNSNASETNENKEPYFKRWELTGTPFNIVNTGVKWFIIFADTQLIDPQNSGTDTDDEISAKALELLENDKWWIVMRVAGVIQHKVAMESVKLMQTEELQENSEGRV